MSDRPDPPAADARFATPPPQISTAELLVRFRRLVSAMVVAAAVMAVLPIPPGVHVVVLLVVPVLLLVVAVTHDDRRNQRFVFRYAGVLWRYRRDRDAVIEAGEHAADVVARGMRRSWLLLGLFVAVFAIGLVLAGASAGISEAIHG